VIANLIGTERRQPDVETLPVYNPATGEVIEQVPLSGPEDVDAAVRQAQQTFQEWSRVPVMERTQLMFRFKGLLERHVDELAEIITRHHGKTLDEARGEVRRGIEVVDFACGAPTLLQGRTLRGVSREVDQDYYRYPLGVVGIIPPFNFPVMIPLWLMPLAVVSGNTVVMKPSERTPLGVVRLSELFLEAGFPPGVFNVVHGAKDAVNALLSHPGVAAISFVGSEAVARYVYQEAARNGKRVQAAGGAKNHIIIMPDAELDVTIPAILNSAFGNAGERCLAGSVAVAVGKARDTFIDVLSEQTAKMVVGPGTEPGVEVGPVIREDHRDRIVQYIDQGVKDGAEILVDGRSYADRPGFFVGPTLVSGVTGDMAIGKDEIFGPVLSVAHVDSLDEAIASANKSALGNMSTIFTTNGHAARQFREHVEAGMVGVNVGVAQPFAFFPFSGWKNSFFGDLHPHGTDGIEFYTRKKVVVTRW
jgi:malonate-semialdehyde dehydrogenase (acetylating)/methylmalonate-semialdehyde dehydrogenase